MAFLHRLCVNDTNEGVRTSTWQKKGRNNFAACDPRVAHTGRGYIRQAAMIKTNIEKFVSQESHWNNELKMGRTLKPSFAILEVDFRIIEKMDQTSSSQPIHLGVTAAWGSSISCRVFRQKKKRNGAWADDGVERSMDPHHQRGNMISPLLLIHVLLHHILKKRQAAGHVVVFPQLSRWPARIASIF